ncbi:MAG: TadE/TadG family type IV pilus assembly protein [Caulobacteraceae bacterium]
MKTASLAGLLQDQRGVAALEMALIAPFLLLILAGTVDLGGVLYTRFQLSSAVNTAANYAIVNASGASSTGGGALAANLATLITNVNGNGWANSAVTVNDGPTASATNGSTATGGTAASADSCYCPTGAAPAITWGAAKTCGVACASGYAGKFVLVTASRSYAPFFSSYGIVQSGAVSVSSMVQVQ